MDIKEMHVSNKQSQDIENIYFLIFKSSSLFFFNQTAAVQYQLHWKPKVHKNFKYNYYSFHQMKGIKKGPKRKRMFW